MKKKLMLPNSDVHTKLIAYNETSFKSRKKQDIYEEEKNYLFVHVNLWKTST